MRFSKPSKNSTVINTQNTMFGMNAGEVLNLTMYAPENDHYYFMREMVASPTGNTTYDGAIYRKCSSGFVPIWTNNVTMEESASGIKITYNGNSSKSFAFTVFGSWY